MSWPLRYGSIPNSVLLALAWSNIQEMRLELLKLTFCKLAPMNLQWLNLENDKSAFGIATSEKSY